MNHIVVTLPKEFDEAMIEITPEIEGLGIDQIARMAYIVGLICKWLDSHGHVECSRLVKEMNVPPDIH